MATVSVQDCPASAFEAAPFLLHLPRPVLLDSSSAGDATGRYSYFSADPFLVVRSRGRGVEMRFAAATHLLCSDPLEALRELLCRFQVDSHPGLPPFLGGAIGYFSYDLGRRLEVIPTLNPTDDLCPDMDIGFYDWTIATDHQSGRSSLVCLDLPGWSAHDANSRFAAIEELLRRSDCRKDLDPLVDVPAFRSRTSRTAYIAAVKSARRSIACGDIYQVSLSHRLEAEWSGESWPLYRLIRDETPVPYGCYLKLDGATIMSFSPERFLRLEGQRVETRPIKGTRPRGDTAEHDRALGAELLASPKDQAENLMIVDLLRNDLGRVCLPGSIEVPVLAGLEGYASVWHLVSTVVGKLRPGVHAVELLRACFPGGSVTGCPKISAMGIIEELEPVRRGIYCGAIGFLSFSGAMDTSIVIRTLIYRNGQLHLQAGGAVTSDSDPEEEYAETLAKADAILRPIGAEVEEW